MDLARQASEQLREQYLIGDTDYLNVLSAITSQQRLQRDILSARLELLLIRVGLYLALAGDFEPRPEVQLEFQDEASIDLEQDSTTEFESTPPEEEVDGAASPQAEELPRPVQNRPEELSDGNDKLEFEQLLSELGDPPWTDIDE